MTDDYSANLQEEVDLKEAVSLHDLLIVIIHTYTTGLVRKIIQTLFEIPFLGNATVCD